jgi:transcriptional regulator with XRE-family HTH domain
MKSKKISVVKKSNKKITSSAKFPVENNLFKTKRLELGLSQSQVANKLGFSSPQFVSNWERGLALPPIVCLPELLKLLKLNKDTTVEYMVKASKIAVESSLRAQLDKTLSSRRR